MVIKDTGFSVSPFSDIGEKPAAGGTEASAQGRTSGSRAAEASASAERTDRIEISARPEKADLFLRKLKAQIRREIDSDADAGRLQDLKESIGSGRYDMGSGALAGALLSGG